MQAVFPDYYKNFKCIASKCRHNCCIGWEIDIDSSTMAFYENVKGKMGERLKNNVSHENEPHFILGENERCPFLNKDNLCDIIIELGEEHICDICAAHPRFINETGDRVETGIGMCCEEAARIILSKKDTVTFEINGEESESDCLIDIRDRAIEILQDRNIEISERIESYLDLFDTEMPDKNIGEWAEFLLGLERLDENWTELLIALKDNRKNLDFDLFDIHMKNRQTEYEQLMVYFVYRHLINALSDIDMAARAAFAVLGYRIIYCLGALIYKKTGKFDFEDQIEIARLFSSEIEYSDENLDMILDELC